MAEAASSAAPVAASTPAAPAAGAQAPAQPTPAQAARMLKLKVDGAELELPESEVIARAQRVSASDARFQEGAKSRKEAEQIIKFAQENPAEFFNKTGKSARQWAEDYLLGEIQREAMSPEQKKAYANEQRLRQYEAAEKTAKDKAHNDQMQALERQHMESYDKMFVQALTESGLPKTAYTVRRMAELTLVNTKKKLDLSPSQLAKIVREDYIAEQRSLYGAIDGDALMELLGKDVVKKLSKAQLAKYKATGKPAVPERTRAEDGSFRKPPPDNPVSAWKALKKKTRSLI